MERIGSKEVHRGPRVTVRQERWRHEDGETEREIAAVDDAVIIVPYDDRFVYLIRQPREPVNEPALLELPAGRLDVEGETPLDCARRELVEEIGCSARNWQEVKSFYPAPGFATETMTMFMATGLKTEGEGTPLPDERIEAVPWPLERLDDAIAECRDGKSLVGLLMLRERLGT